MKVGLSRNAEAGNYLQWLASLCRPYLGRRCLEIGSGHGDLTELLADGRELHATDLSERCLALLEERFQGRDNVRVRTLDVASFELEERYDSIVMVNVLEHI